MEFADGALGLALLKSLPEWLGELLPLTTGPFTGRQALWPKLASLPVLLWQLLTLGCRAVQAAHVPGECTGIPARGRNSRAARFYRLGSSSLETPVSLFPAAPRMWRYQTRLLGKKLVWSWVTVSSCVCQCPRMAALAKPAQGRQVLTPSFILGCPSPSSPPAVLLLVLAMTDSSRKMDISFSISSFWVSVPGCHTQQRPALGAWDCLQPLCQLLVCLCPAFSHHILP